MNRNQKLNWISPLILILTSIWVAHEGLELSNYIICFLILLTNGQLRIHVLKGKGILGSIFLELILIFFLSRNYGGMTYLLGYIAIFDALRFLKEERIVTIPFAMGIVFYILKDGQLEVLILNFLLLLVLVLLIMLNEKLYKSLKDLEDSFDKNRNYSYTLEDTKERLEKYNKNIEHLTQVEERNRISREIHDTIGHKLTATLLQLEAVIRTTDFSEDAMLKLSSVKDNLSGSIDILRKTVKNMGAKDNITGLNSLKKLVEDFQKSTDVNVELEIKGLVRKLYPSIELAIYKNVQESMTNAVRHGMCRNIKIKIEYLLNEVNFSIHNDGIGCEKVKLGMGLNGMQERTELVGGKLVIVPLQMGFEVTGTIPIMGEVG